MPGIFSDPFGKVLVKDYQIPQSQLIGRQVLVATNLMMILVIFIELIFDLSATSIELLIPSFLMNLILLFVSLSKKSVKNIEKAHIVILYVIVEVHFFADPAVFHILVYWMPFLPLHALITSGIKTSHRWMIVTAATMVANGYYGAMAIGTNYQIAPDFSKFTSAGVLFLLCIYAGFYLLYYLLGDAYASTKQKNQEIERLNNELKDLNDSLEDRVSSRTKDLNEKTDRLERIAYMNSHEVRSSLSKIIGASHAIELDKNERERLITVMVESSKDLDDAIKAMSAEIEKKID